MTTRILSTKRRISSWTEIYRRQGHRWGMLPSLCAHLALAEIAKLRLGHVEILDVGCGYGRDLAFFGHVFPSSSVMGLDGSRQAIEMARLLLPGSALIHSDVFEVRPVALKQRCNVTFTNYFLHLLFDDEIIEALRLMRSFLATGGRVLASFVSIRDRHYGKGRRLGFRCYEVATGMPWRFTDEEEVQRFFEQAGLRTLLVEPYSEVELVMGRPDLVESIFIVAERA